MKYTAATWLRSRYELYAKPHIRPSTMNYYRRNIEQHIIPAIGDIPLNKLTTRDLQKLYGVHSRDRCSKRSRRKWAASWRRFDKSHRKTEHRKRNNFLSGALWLFPYCLWANMQSKGCGAKRNA